MAATENTSRRSVLATVLTSVTAAAGSLFFPGRASARGGIPARAPADALQGDKAPLFSGSKIHGDLVFVAGKGEHGPGDITVHTKSVLDQIEAELKKAGSSMDKVLKVNVYLHDIKDYDAMNAAYRGRFGANPPVRTTVACYGGIPGSSLVEIDCIATR